MLRDTLMFWGVYLGFFFASTLLFVGATAETARLGGRGRFRAELRHRLAFGRREMVLTNPLDLFDLMVVSDGDGAVDPGVYRRDRELARRLRGWCVPLAWSGYAYLALTVAIAALSVRLGFAAMVVPLLLLHVLFATLMAAIVSRAWRDVPGLTGSRWAFIAEAFLVPAYVINAAKRLCQHAQLATPMLALAAREARRTADESRREVLVYGIHQRLEQLEARAPSQADLDAIRSLKACLPKT